MSEEALYDRVIEVGDKVDELLADVLKLRPTTELAIFAGSLGAVGMILAGVAEAGIPVRDPHDPPRSTPAASPWTPISDPPDDNRPLLVRGLTFSGFTVAQYLGPSKTWIDAEGKEVLEVTHYAELFEP